jgi:hypothetical protein
MNISTTPLMKGADDWPQYVLPLSRFSEASAEVWASWDRTVSGMIQADTAVLTSTHRAQVTHSLCSSLFENPFV